MGERQGGKDKALTAQTTDEFAQELGRITKFLLDRHIVPVEIPELLIARCFATELDFRFADTEPSENRDRLIHDLLDQWLLGIGRVIGRHIVLTLPEGALRITIPSLNEDCCDLRPDNPTKKQ